MGQNLAWLSQEQEKVSEEKQLLLRQYFDSKIQPNVAFSKNVENLSRLCEVLLRKNENTALLSLAEKVGVSELLSQYYAPQILMSGLPQIKGDTKIACWAFNRYSAMAYERFSCNYPEWKQVAVESFTDVCELINNGSCEFGILPIENSVDGRLASFYRLIDRYEFKICAVCDVENEKGDAFTRLALVAKSLRRLGDGLPKEIELSCTSSHSGTLVNLIEVADKMDISIKRVSSVSLYYRKDACVVNLTLSLTEPILVPFLAYLRIFERDVNVIGLYNLI